VPLGPVFGSVTRGASGQRYAPRVPDEQGATVVERDEIAVMFKRVADEQTAISRGWVELEEAVGSLRGRRFYGAFDETSREYHVCVQRRQGDRPASLGLELGTLPGGRYARVRLQGEPPAVYELIAPAFEALAKRADHDQSRPGIEFYRRRDVIDLLLPIT
jgi:hypothetical protein